MRDSRSRCQYSMWASYNVIAEDEGTDPPGLPGQLPPIPVTSPHDFALRSRRPLRIQNV